MKISTKREIIKKLKALAFIASEVVTTMVFQLLFKALIPI